MTVTKKEIFLKDYTSPPYLIESVELRFELEEHQTRVHSRLNCNANNSQGLPLELNGEELELMAVTLDGEVLESAAYTFGDGLLTIPGVPAGAFTLEVETLIDPAANTALEGLYLSSGNYCTQCEAEGFRRITCFPDRPDVMAVFTTTVIADPGRCPVLLSNGNLVDSGELADGRHFATWHDPFKKPSYLFALVAGDLVCLEDSFTTISGRKIELRIYVEPRNQEKCDHAMASLKKAMAWDEEVFGREYDLDTYMIVAVDDFNMGAMENKGLNVFNSKYVLATPETATDADFDGIEGVIAHEYFHNWTGNRITCRDWFQLSLKEGLTVFRDQEFSADMSSRAVKRIQDANIIRSLQFREDGGPMAHPVRPASFVEINNFYTLTVYNKGAEVIRMLHTLLGREGFRRGMDLYFERHDGQAVTCDDFVQAMADANEVDFHQFKRWYSQAGTPVLEVVPCYEPDQGRYTLRVSQSCPPTPEAGDKEPFIMPLKVGLLEPGGRVLSPRPESGEVADENGTVVLQLKEQEQEFLFSGLEEEPVVSFLRGFSAPVRVKLERSPEEQALLMAADPDPFNRWDAGQELGLGCILAQLERYLLGETIQLNPILSQGIRALLEDSSGDPALLAMAMNLPSEHWIGQQLEQIDPVAVFTVRQGLRSLIARQLAAPLEERYLSLAGKGGYRYSPEETGRRSLRNSCLGYLLSVDPGAESGSEHLELGISQYRQADNMTDRIAALQGVVNSDQAAGAELLADFHDQWQHDPLVMDKWLMIQACCTLPGTLERVRELLDHPVFSLKNPNKVRSLIGAFCSMNHAQFHGGDGRGYAFLGEMVRRLDAMNPQIASRLATPLTQWRRYDQGRQQLMEAQLRGLQQEASLSGDLREIVERSLKL
ncbi:aminopeptidase N [Desulfogranum mediterraneum]|uniref:aminopeptidase N n=1 Tax=Desulfogranum mediterraneum TaxID=160661 RepID=UPI00040F58F1|nr:aminopeptidase N [Desulfogranum mediterraneum]